MGKPFLSLAAAGALPCNASLAFNSRTRSELQTARIGLTADLSTAGGLAAGTLQFIDRVPKTSSNACCKKQVFLYQKWWVDRNLVLDVLGWWLRKAISNHFEDNEGLTFPFLQ
jgi:hypothetical protein